MSRLKELIAELCPDGVEFKSLGEICVITRGIRVTKKDLLPNGKYPVVSGGTGFMGYLDEYNREAGTITIAQYGTAGYVKWQLQRFWANDVCFSVITDEKIIQNRYLYYFLTNNQEYLYSISNRDAIPYSIDREKILKMKAPVPPVEVQREIVRILDKFSEKSTELCELLSSELVARKKQYEYYREKLLTFGDDVPRVRLGEIGKICMCKRIMKNETNSVGGIPFYKIGTFGKEPNAYISEELYEEYRNKFSYPKKGDILISASGTIGRTVVFDGEPSYFQDSNIVWIDNDEKLIINKFLRHIYQTTKWKTEGGTIKRLYNEILAGVEIPLPPLPEQKHIADILDRFESRYNELSVSIPAEIAARKKQYEYYRDRLLTFREKRGE